MGTENKYVTKILKTNEEIVEGIKILSKKLNSKYSNESKPVVIITILKGGLPFSLELVKHLDFDIEMDFISSSSYYLDSKKDEHNILYQPTISIKDKHVILVDDLIDTGETSIKLTKLLEEYNPKSITLSAVYGKPSRKITKYDEAFVWEEDPCGFLLGFGLDYNEKYRNLPYIAIMEVPEDERKDDE